MLCSRCAHLALCLPCCRPGIQIEEPFRVLPLDQMCAAARRATTFMLTDMLSVRSMAASSAATRLQPAGKQQQGGTEAEQQAAAKEVAEQQEAVRQQAEELGDGGAANLEPAGPAGPAVGPAMGLAGALSGESVRRAAPFQFSQMSILPEGWDQGNELQVTELLGLAAGRAPRRSSLDGQRLHRGGGTVSGSSDGGGSGQGSPRHGPRRRSFDRPSRLAVGSPAVALPAVPAGGGSDAGAQHRRAGPREGPDVEQALQHQAGGRGDSASSSVAARLLGGAAGTAAGRVQAAGTPGQQQGAQGSAQAAEGASGWEPVPYPEARWHGNV